MAFATWRNSSAFSVAIWYVRWLNDFPFLGVSGDELYELLAAVRGDRKADSFLTKLLAMGDYHHFGEMMRWLGRVESRKFTTSL